ncbi:uncharacterized protein LOC132938811 [Metopolophium dirhodum]|uniref:uncharacterized protein LOC132938811 n=1 Tax=Metopolophium dirhodum TaxID=44670 RepID=UPI00298F58C4|nr:uncharacterized protein LOC132938811 [Metopolophium dirhodum]
MEKTRRRWKSSWKSANLHWPNSTHSTKRLTFEEMVTLTSRIEALLNSRPITPLSADPNDYRALTSGHFLIGHPMVEIPEKDVLDDLKTVSNVEYLSSLQRRKKWVDNQPNVNDDDLVLINMPNQPPIHWKLGHIQQVHPGADGVVRVATVRTEHGTLTRSIVKLAILPPDN